MDGGDKELMHVPKLYRMNLGSCNGCDVELATTAIVSSYHVEQLGCQYCDNPEEADLVIITGPLTVRIREEALQAFARVADPRVVVAVGVCSISGGVFRESQAVEEQLDQCIPVDINVPGCPPRPQAMLEGISKALELWRSRAQQGIDLKGDKTEFLEAPDEFRGKAEFDEAACVACKTCEHVCAGGAIRIGELEDQKGSKFMLWHNTCVFCGLCEYYCPTKAIHLTADYHTTHPISDKYTYTEKGTVKYEACARCGQPVVPPNSKLMAVAHGRDKVETDTPQYSHLCTQCRRQQAVRQGGYSYVKNS